MEIRTSFDFIDAYILTNRFTLPELRYELHQADLELTTCETFGLDAEAGYWRAYKELVSETMASLRANTPKPSPAAPGRVDTEAIKARADIVGVIGEHIELRKAGRNFKAVCPFHADSNPSLTVYPEQQSWHCFGCDKGGDVFTFTQLIANTDFRGAAAILGGH